jgi:hypothetical protein
MRRLAFAFVVPLVAFAACGNSEGPSGFTDQNDGGGDQSDGGASGGPDTGDLIGNDGGATAKVTAIAINPPGASIEVLNGAPASQAFTVKATLDNGNVLDVTSGVAWSRDNPSVGTIDGKGLYAASGLSGGVVTITAKLGAVTATAPLTVKLHITQNPGNAPAGTQGALQGATSPDAQITWAYPYDGTVLPRGLNESPLMWMGGAAADLYYVHLVSKTFELETYTTAPASRYDFDATGWRQFTDSTAGAAELKVARWNGTAATLLVDHHYTVGDGSMRGTIYYWAINTGRVMRIKPGAAAPDDFLGPTVQCPSCHTVSANGSRLVMSEGNWPNTSSITYDLVASTNAFSGFAVTTGASRWSLAGVSADGAVLVQDFAPLRGNIAVDTGAFDAVTSTPIPATGIEGKQAWMPAFSPDNKLFAYVDGAASKDLRAYDWDPVAKKFTNDRLIVAAGADASKNVISFPTISPDHQWIVYQRSSGLGSLGNASDLYAASVANPGTEVLLANLDGTTYPFAAGDRDRHLSYEPTFAPVAAGGYFWLVFHSRRTYGTVLTGPAYVGEGNGTKQLWVAAFDQSPKGTADPSHPAFHLEGQDTTTLNMRGAWALEPCRGDGVGCQSGTECCGGYCGAAPDGGLVCLSQSAGCSQDGDKCKVASDCCNAPQGATCINAVCSVAPPK